MLTQPLPRQPSHEPLIASTEIVSRPGASIVVRKLNLTPRGRAALTAQSHGIFGGADLRFAKAAGQDALTARRR